MDSTSGQEVEIYYLTAPYQLELKKERLSPQLSDQQICAQTVRTVISPGTEVAAYVGLPPLRPGQTYPRLVGYCNVARILRKGKTVKDFSEGDLILTFQSHRSVFICDQKDIILKISDSVDPAYAACTYLYHLGYAALLSGQCLPGFNVAVMGLGTLGYACVELAQILGYNVFAVTGQRHLAAFLKGKDISVIDKNNESFANVQDMTSGTGIDVVINTSNTWIDWLFALKLARKGGVIVNLGFPGRGQPPPDFNPLDSQYLYDKQLTIKACGHVSEKDMEPFENRFSLKRNMTFLFQLIATGRLQPSYLLSFECSAAELDLAYRKISDRENKVLFTGVLKWD